MNIKRVRFPQPLVIFGGEVPVQVLEACPALHIRELSDGRLSFMRPIDGGKEIPMTVVSPPVGTIVDWVYDDEGERRREQGWEWGKTS